MPYCRRMCALVVQFIWLQLMFHSFFVLLVHVMEFCTWSMEWLSLRSLYMWSVVGRHTWLWGRWCYFVSLQVMFSCYRPLIAGYILMCNIVADNGCKLFYDMLTVAWWWCCAHRWTKSCLAHHLLQDVSDRAIRWIVCTNWCHFPQRYLAGE